MGEVLGIPLLKLLDILAVPIAVGFAVPLFAWLQRWRELKVDNHRRQEDGLQAYLDQMRQLLLDKKLRKLEANREALTAARVGTLTTLERIHHDDKKGIIVNFLCECDLLEKQEPVVSLKGANLKGANLVEANLIGANLREVALCPRETKVPWKTKSERANLGGAQLCDADLSKADLSKALLRGADLSGANLAGANLSKSNLGHAKVTEEQLAACKSLKEAIMPNDQKYENWLKTSEAGKRNEDLRRQYKGWLRPRLKDKEGRGKAGENRGPS
jgi:pentapeptide repeat protein